MGIEQEELGLYKQWRIALRTLQKDEAELKDKMSDFRNKVKDIQKEREKLIFDGPLANLPDESFYSSDEEQVKKNKKNNNNWKCLKVNDYFQLTESQLDKLGLNDASTVGQLSDVIQGIQNGRKIASVGKGLVEKVISQFEHFWDVVPFGDVKSELPEYENTDSLLSPYEEAKDYLCRIKALYQKFDSNRLFMDRIEKISEIESQIDKDNSVSQDQIDFLSLVCEEMEKYYISINKAKHSS